VQVGLGKNMEAILVDTDKTAHEGIKYLKEQRVGVATFIPCDSVRVDPLRETLRDLGGSVCRRHVCFFIVMFRTFLPTLSLALPTHVP
jgi:chromosome segregation ATPase